MIINHLLFLNFLLGTNTNFNYLYTFLYKDLSIYFNPSLNLEYYISYTVGKTLKVLGFLK